MQTEFHSPQNLIRKIFCQRSPSKTHPVDIYPHPATFKYDTLASSRYFDDSGNQIGVCEDNLYHANDDLIILHEQDIIEVFYLRWSTKSPTRSPLLTRFTELILWFPGHVVILLQ